MVKALIGLGANLGKPAENLDAAKSALAQLASTTLIETSDWFSTAAVGGPDGQDEFLNGAALVETDLPAATLVGELQRIERTLGRERIVRWGPRLIDLDIVLYGDQIVDRPDLTIPHPWMALRRFVLQPASQIAPTMIHPRIEWSIQRLFENLCGDGIVELTSTPNADKASAVAWLVGQVDCVADSGLDDASRQPESARPSLSLGQLMQRTDRWFECRDETLRKRNTSAVKQEFVCCRWPEELLAVGKVHLTSDAFNRFREKWESRFGDVASPKLLIVFTDSSDTTNEDPIADEMWHRIQRPGRGPWLVLDVSDPERVRHDLLAALTGMR